MYLRLYALAVLETELREGVCGHRLYLMLDQVALDGFEILAPDRALLGFVDGALA